MFVMALLRGHLMNPTFCPVQIYGVLMRAAGGDASEECDVFYEPRRPPSQ